MICKLAARDSRSSSQFKPQIYQDKGRGQNRGSYDKWGYQNRYRADSEDRRQYRKDRVRPRYKQSFRRGNFRGNVRRV